MDKQLSRIASFLRGRLLLGAIVGVVLAATLVVLGAWWLQPRYDIDLGQVRSYEQVRLAKELRDSLQRAQEWQSPLVDAANITALTVWIRHPDNASAATLEDLLRKSDVPNFAVLNGLVTLLPSEAAERLPEWRKAEEPKVTSELTRLAQQVDSEQRQLALGRILQDVRYRTSLDAWQVPLPQEESLLERVAAWVWSKRRPNVVAWTDQYVASYDDQVARFARLYDELSKRELLALGKTAGESESLFVRKLSAGASQSPLAFAGEQSTTDWEIVHRTFGKASAGQVVATEVATGVELFTLPWTNIEPKDDGELLDLHPQWPPPSVSSRVRLRSLQAFLRRSGLPPGLRLHAVSVEAAGSWESPELSLRLTLKHPDLTSFEQRADLVLAGKEATPLEKQLTKIAAAAAESAKKAALDMRELAGIPVRIKPSPDPLVWQATFSPPKTPPFTLRGQVNDELSLVFEPLPQLAERLAWRAWLVKSEPQLAVAEDQIRLKQLEVGSGAEGVALTWELAGKGRAQPQSLQTHISHDGTVHQEISDAFAQQIADLASAPPKPKPTPTATKVSEDEALEAAQQELDTAFAKVAPFVQLVVRETQGAVALHAMVQIADWPALELGPQPVVSPAQRPSPLSKLLSAESVQQAAAVQWTSAGKQGVRRMGVGRANGQIDAWNPNTGEVEVHCSAPIAGRSVQWQESLKAAKQAWAGMTVEEIGRQIISKLNWSFSPNDTSIPVSLRGVLLGVDPDPDIRDGSWLQLNPLRLRLRGRVHVPCLLGLTAVAEGNVAPRVALSSRVMVDQERGFQLNEIGIVLERTWQLPWCNLSDPTIRLNLEERMLTLSTYITPPLPSTGAPLPVPLIGSVRTDNLWLYISAMQCEMGGSLDATRFRARTHLELLQYAKVASGEADLDFLEQQITGQLEANNSLPLLGPVLPLRAAGLTQYSWKQGTLLTQCDLSARRPNRGHLDVVVRFRDEPRQIELRGDVQVPSLASQLLTDGHATLDGQSFALNGNGNIGVWVVSFEARPSGITWNYYLAGMQLPWQCKAGTIDDVDENAIGAQLQRLEEKAGSIAEASEDAEAFVKQYFTLSTAPTPPDEPPPKPGALSKFQPVSKPIVVERDDSAGQIVAYVVDGGARGELFRFPVSAVELPGALADYRLAAWTLRLPEKPKEIRTGAGHLLIFDPLSPRVIDVFVPSPNEPVQVNDQQTYLAKVHQGEPLGCPAVPPEGVDTKRRQYLRDVVKLWFDGVLSGREIKKIDFRLTDLGIEMESPNALGDLGHRLATLFTTRDERQQTIYLDADDFAVAQRDALFARLRGVNGDWWYLQGLGGDEQSLLYALPQQVEGVTKWHATLTGAVEWTNVPIDFIGMPPAFDVQTATLAKALLAQPTLIVPHSILVGPEGAMVFDAANQNRVALVHAGESPPRLYIVTKGDFVRWDNADSLFLTAPAWRTADSRSTLNWSSISRTTLLDWSETRAKEPQWGANPLGLLIGLSK